MKPFSVLFFLISSIVAADIKHADLTWLQPIDIEKVEKLQTDESGVTLRISFLKYFAGEDGYAGHLKRSDKIPIKGQSCAWQGI